jgi:hypothetical protein
VSIEWGDHFEHRLTLGNAGACDGAPSYPEGCDQRTFCAEGCIVVNDGDFHLPVGKLAEFVVTLYAAAGKPAPLILERPDYPRSSLELGGATFSVRPGGVEEFRVHDGTQSGVLHEPGVIRRIAACLAVLAEEAEGGPDPAEVEELAELIRAELYPLSERIGLRPSEADRTAARAALRWMNKQQRGEGL